MSEPPFIWCPVANVTSDPHPEGPDAEMRLGTKQFAPGAKLYVFPVQWGDGGDALRVIGRQRSSPKMIEIIVRSKWLVNWRVQKVYQPFVVHRMRNWWCKWDDSEESRLKADAMARSFARALDNPRDSANCIHCKRRLGRTTEELAANPFCSSCEAGRVASRQETKS